VIGERIGNFRIVSQLGAGGMGEVFLGEHDKIGTKVAIKMLQPHISANTEHVQRFFNEAIAVSKIQHAGTGKIFDVGFTEAGRAYLVMEFLDGETLATRIRRLGRLPLAMVSDIGKQMTSVLEAVHRAGITHRDLKPDNVFIVADSELASGERVKILDFGIAKLSGNSGGMTATSAGSMGTPAYMSPEQWKNSKNVDWRADAYSLGCLAFEMIAGRPPFLAESIGEACAKHLSEEAPHLRSIVPTPIALDTLIASLLAKDPDQRPKAMREIGNGFAALGISDQQRLAATIVPGSAATAHASPSDSAPIPMMVARTDARSPNTTLGSAAASVQQPGSGPPKHRTMLLVLALGGVALAGVVTVLAVWSSSSSKPEDVVATRGETPGDLPAPPPQAPTTTLDPSARTADAALEREPVPPALPASNPLAVDAGIAEVATPAVVQRKPPAVAAPKGGALSDPLGDRPATSVTGIGWLSLGAKPPCEVFVDGVNTGLSTPQPKIPLPAGKHKITLVNQEFGIKENIGVTIQPDLVEKVMKDFSDRIDAVASPPISAPAGFTCDEVSCLLLDKAEREHNSCCAKFSHRAVPKPALTEQAAGDLPESLDRSTISAAVATIKGRVITCGDKSSAKGTVKVSVKVNPDGSVSSVTVKDTPDPGLGSCVAAAMQRARFAKTQNGGSFGYPFVFRNDP